MIRCFVAATFWKTQAALPWKRLCCKRGSIRWGRKRKKPGLRLQLTLGIKQSLRQDPDIILIGEIRDFLTMEAALHAAETGHLVLSTLHTRSAPQAISRVVGMSPAGRQADIRCRLALILQAVLAQQGKQEEEGYRIFREILVVTPAVSQLIRSGKEYQLPAVMQTGAQFGMRTMAQALQRGRRL